MIFETHAHYDDEQFDEDREQLLAGLQEAGIETVVNVGATLEGCLSTIRLAEQYPFIYAAVGVHPDEVGTLDEEKFSWLKEKLSHEKVVAVGEIGLDYYWDKESHELQKEWFKKQMELAKEVDLPVIVHSREAAQDTFDLIKSEHAGTTGGVIHCFSGSKEMAKEYIKMGYYIGVGGVVTFKNARVLKEVVESIPLERILTETDCPYLAPVPFRGKRNCSAYISYVLDMIAELKGISREEAEQVTYENARNMYRITD